MELIDGNVIKQIQTLNPNQLKDIIEAPLPAFSLLVEFDNADRHLKKMVKKSEKILDKYATSVSVTTDPEQQQQYWKLRQSVSSLLGHNDGLIMPVPLVDAGVPLDRLREYIEGVYSILDTNNIRPGIWGHVGDGILKVQPRLNIGQVGDRQKAFRFMDEYHKLVLKLGGTISSENGDGRLRTPYLERMYGIEQYGLMQKIKNIFDPYATLNPGVKFGTSMDDLKEMIRSSYGIDHIYDHLPRS